MEKNTAVSIVDFVEIGVRQEDRRNLEARLKSRRFEEVDQLEGAPIVLWQRDGIRLLLNHHDEGYARDFKARQGTGPVSIGLVVSDVQASWQRTIQSGAWPVGEYIRPDLPFPALFGPEDVLVYFTRGMQATDELRWLDGGKAIEKSASYSFFVSGEPERREWNFWLDEVLSLPRDESTVGLRGFGECGGLRFSSRHEDADLFFVRSRAIKGLSFSGRRFGVHAPQVWAPGVSASEPQALSFSRG